MSLAPEVVSRDYTNAQTYVTDFYGTYARIQDDLGEAAHRSINKFSQISGISDSRLGANIVYQLIRIALGILPGSGIVTNMFDKLSQGRELAITGARLATIVGVVAQRTASGVYTATSTSNSSGAYATTALDNLSRYDTEGAARIEQERTRIRSLVEQLGRNLAYRNRVLTEVQNSLGPLPTYNPQVIQQFEKEYEIQLYKRYYTPITHIEINESATWGVHSRLVMGMPESVQRRIAEILRTPILQVVQSWGVRTEVHRVSGRPY